MSIGEVSIESPVVSKISQFLRLCGEKPFYCTEWHTRRPATSGIFFAVQIRGTFKIGNSNEEMSEEGSKLHLNLEILKILIRFLN